MLVVFIPKAGKSSHIGPKDYRPISLSSFPLETLERLIDLYLRSNINWLGVNTYCRSFLDIEGAFTKVTTSSIESSIRNIHALDFLVRFITHMLGNRIIRSNLGRCSIVRRPTRGTPQWGVISPLLLLLADNGALRRLESRGFKVVAYANDAVILGGGDGEGTDGILGLRTVVWV